MSTIEQHKKIKKLVESNTIVPGIFSIQKKRLMMQRKKQERCLHKKIHKLTN